MTRRPGKASRAMQNPPVDDIAQNLPVTRDNPQTVSGALFDDSVSGLLAAVAVCTYERYDLLAECFDSLVAQTLPSDEFEILVIDNSPDATRSSEEARLYAHIPNLRWIHEKIPGLSNARNVAARETTAPIIAYIDDDAVPHPTWLRELLAAYDELGDEVYSIGGRVLPRFGQPRPPWLSDKLLAYLSVIDLGHETRILRPGEWVAGANISYRTPLLRAVGGFSPALGRIGSGIALMSNDETELAERLSARGGVTGYAGLAVVDHLVDPSRVRQDWFRRRMAWQAVSDYVRAPGEQFARSEAAWLDLKRFFAQQPPHVRTQRALVIEQADPSAREWQLAAIYEAVISLLSGISEADD